MILVDESARPAGAMLKTSGFTPWIKNTLPTVADSGIMQLQVSMTAIKTEATRERVVRKIDHSLQEISRCKNEGVLHELLSSAVSQPVKPNSPSLVDSDTYLALEAVDLVLTTIRDNDGTRSDCINGLTALRKDVVELKLPTVGKAYYEQTLQEGLATVLRNVATGNVESEIEELKKESKDIHTPEQQRYVITKIIRLLERLIVLRHNPTYVQRQYHDAVSWFGRVLGRDNSVKELGARMGEAIRDLSRLRDQVLAKRWNDEKYNDQVDALKTKVTDLLTNAGRKSTEDYE